MAFRSRSTGGPSRGGEGCDAATLTYYQLYSDDRGVCRVYEMSIGDGDWRLWPEGEPFPHRFTGTFQGEATQSWAAGRLRRTATNYETDFDLIYRGVAIAELGHGDRLK